MKKIMLIFTLSMSVLQTYGASTNKDTLEKVGSNNAINQVDSSGRKHGKWILYGKDKPDKGYPTEAKVEEGFYKENRKNGLWIYYYEDGKTPKLKGYYEDNRPNGPFTKYFPNGNIQEEGTFSKNRYVDSLKRYNEEGTLIFEAVYDRNGLENGRVSHYHQNGKPQYVYHSERGKPVGEAVRYWPNGEIKERILYDAEGKVQETSGVIKQQDIAEEQMIAAGRKAPIPPKNKSFKANGYNKLLNKAGELLMEGEFKNGRLWDGRLYVYDEDGLLLRLEVYRNGIFHSEGQL
ncbi:MAG: hypothetical protein R3277_12150 [Brumimicrobium sp.]|nr:hypothetical protein [Brumimicrobium sp.]